MSSVTITGRSSPPMEIPAETVEDKTGKEIAKILSGEITEDMIAAAQELFFTIYPVNGPQKELRTGEKEARTLLYQARQQLYLMKTVPLLTRTAAAST